MKKADEVYTIFTEYILNKSINFLHCTDAKCLNGTV